MYFLVPWVSVFSWSNLLLLSEGPRNCVEMFVFKPRLGIQDGIQDTSVFSLRDCSERNQVLLLLFNMYRCTHHIFTFCWCVCVILLMGQQMNTELEFFVDVLKTIRCYTISEFTLGFTWFDINGVATCLGSFAELESHVML